MFLSLEQEIKAQARKSPSYDQFKDRLEQAPGFEQLYGKVESRLGFSIEDDFLKILGNNFGVVFKGIAHSEIEVLAAQGQPQATQKFPIPFPELYCFVELKDAARAAQLLESGMNAIAAYFNSRLKQPLQQDKPEAQASPALPQQKLKIVPEVYQDVTLNTLVLEGIPFNFISPNYAIVDNYVIFSLSPLLTKKAIEVHKNKEENLESNYAFGSLKNTFLPHYGSIFFLDFGKLLNTIQTEVFKFMLLQQRDPKVKENMDEAMSLLGAIKAVGGTRAKVEADAIEMKGCLKVDGL